MENYSVLLANGYHIVPITPGTKRPANAGWQNSRLTPMDFAAYPDHGVGVLCGDIVGIDIDISHPVIGPAVIAYCEKHIGAAPKRVGAAPRVMLVYRGGKWGKRTSARFFDPTDATKPSGKRNDQQIEVLGKGQQFVACAIHPDTGKPYEWIDLFGGLEYWRAADLAVVTETQIDALFMEVARLIRETPGLEAVQSVTNAYCDDDLLSMTTRTGISLEEAVGYLGDIENNFSYDDWVQIGMGLHHEFGSIEAFAIWETWSKTSAKYVEGEGERKWRSFGKGSKSVSIRWLIKLARIARADKIANDQQAASGQINDLIASAEDKFDLTDRVAKKIRTLLPLVPALQAEALGNYQDRFCDLTGQNLPMADARRHLVDPIKKHTERDSDVMSDLYIGTRLADLMAGKFLFEHGGRGWLIYVSGLWQACRKGEEVEAAKLVGPQILRDSHLAPETAIDLAQRAMGAKGIYDALRLAQSDMRLAASPSEFDTDIELINCVSGIVHLPTGDLMRHDPALRMSRQCRVEYSADTLPPARWLRFLDDVSKSDPDWIDYVQHLCGYILTGHVREEVLIFMLGWGANGKSVLANVLRRIMGNYAITVPSGFLMVSKNNGGDAATPSIAALPGARLVLANEIEAGQRLSAQVVKSVCSTEAIAARQLYGKTFSFVPTHKVLVRGNHKPIITDNDEGIWRRIHLLPFDRHFGPDEKDMGLEETLMREARGIFAWMVRGAVEYFKSGLKPAKRVAAASSDYRKDSDLLAHWLDDETDKHPGNECLQSDAYCHYRNWSQSQGLHPITKNSLSRQLTERGFTVGQKTGGRRERTYKGFEIRGFTAVSYLFG